MIMSNHIKPDENLPDKMSKIKEICENFNAYIIQFKEKYSNITK